MTLAHVDLYRYKIPLSAPLRLRDATIRFRRGLLVRLCSENGATAWGEAAPLPGFSAESLDVTISYASSQVGEWVGLRLPTLDENLVDGLDGLPLDADCPASLRFALESAVIELTAATRDTSAAHVLGNPRETVHLNALIGDVGHVSDREVAEIVEEGYRAVKVKVGRRSVSSEASAIRRLVETLSGRATLRLDANRAWDLEEAIQFARSIPSTGVEYLEEPLSNPGALSSLSSQVQCPLALDETTREWEADELFGVAGVAAVVLKPTLLGGIRETLLWMRVAEESGITPVISSSYETGIGLRMLVAMAAIGPETPAGLSTYNRLGRDVLTTRLPLDASSIDVAAVTGATVQVDGTSLDRISVSR